ncbi:MAG: hypothetical protein AAFX05_14300, partial [Planctomycetota bacterium]
MSTTIDTSPDTGSAASQRPRTANIEIVVPAFNEELNLPHARGDLLGPVGGLGVNDEDTIDPV